MAKLDIAADSDSEGRGFESLRAGQIYRSRISVGGVFNFIGDSNPERVSGVKKTVRWTVFRREVRGGCATRTDDARAKPVSGIIPYFMTFSLYPYTTDTGYYNTFPPWIQYVW